MIDIMRGPAFRVALLLVILALIVFACFPDDETIRVLTP